MSGYSHSYVPTPETPTSATSFPSNRRSFELLNERGSTNNAQPVDDHRRSVVSGYFGAAGDDHDDDEDEAPLSRLGDGRDTQPRFQGRAPSYRTTASTPPLSGGPTYRMDSPAGGSFVGGRGTPGAHGRTDSSSYFRTAADQDDEDDNPGFDVYQDFNNVGARYSQAFSSADLYRDAPAYLSSPSNAALNSPMNEKSKSKSDLVALPTLGTDWKRGEALKEDVEARGAKVNDRKGWAKQSEVGGTLTKGVGQGLAVGVAGVADGLGSAGRKVGRRIFDKKRFCGVLKWKYLMFVVMFLLVALGVMLYFLIPRVPLFQFDSIDPLTSSDTNPSFSRIPASFSFDASANLAVDARSNYLPVHFSSIGISVTDLNTGKLVGTGQTSGLSVPGRAITPFDMPFKFSYTANSDNDTTWNDFYNACKHEWAGQAPRPGLEIAISLTMSINGLIGQKGAGTQLGTVACPIELPSTSV